MDQLDLLPLLEGQPEYIQRIIIDLFPFAIALLIILLLRWLLTAILLRPLRFIARRTASEVDDKLLEASVSPIRLAVIGFSLMLVTWIFTFDVAVENLAVTFGRALLVSAFFFGAVRWYEVLSLRSEVFQRATGWNDPRTPAALPEYPGQMGHHRPRCHLRLARTEL